VKIEEIALTNFRSYRKTQKINNLSDVNSFIGPNGAGKSNVLEALKLIKQLCERRMGQFIEIIYDRNPNAEITISVQFSLSDAERDKMLERLFKGNMAVKVDNIKETPFFKAVTLSLTISERGVKNETIEASNIQNNNIGILKKDMDNQNPPVFTEQSGDVERKCRSLQAIHNLGISFRTIATRSGPSSQILDYQHASDSEKVLVKTLKEFINGWNWFDPNRKADANMDSGEEKELTSSGNNLTKFMNSYSGTSPRLFTGLTDEVNTILQEIEDIIAPLKERKATLKVKEKGLKTHTEVNNISYGYMQILILVIGIITKKATSLMIEEPELHLHASAQRRLS
jgi:predicted ATPase